MIVSVLNTPVRLSDLLQRIASIDDGFDLPGLNQLFDGDQICKTSRGNRPDDFLVTDEGSP